jgi:hypothetical protein
MQSKESFEDILKFLMKFFDKNEILKMFKEKDENFLVPLHFAARNLNSNVFDFALKIYQKNFTCDEIKEILNSKVEWNGRKNVFYSLVEAFEEKIRPFDEKEFEKRKEIILKMAKE